MNDQPLTAGVSVFATGKGLNARPRLGTVEEVLPKGFIVKFPDGSRDKFPAKKVRPASPPRQPPRPLESLLALPTNKAGLPLLVLASSLENRPVEPITKPARAARSDSYLEWIRCKPCCNCQAPPRSDPHHEGRHPVARKVADHKAVPLCRLCHTTFTDKNALPDPVASGPGGIVLRTPESSREILHLAQLACLREAWSLVPASLPLLAEIEMLSTELGKIEERQLAAALAGRAMR